MKPTSQDNIIQMNPLNTKCSKRTERSESSLVWSIFK